MDKDSVILKYLQNEVADADKDIKGLKKRNINRENALEGLDNKLDEVYSLLNMKKREINPIKQPQIVEQVPLKHSDYNYEELYYKASRELIKRGLDIDSLDYHSLVSED